jgi:hypothetical protein
VHGGQRRGTIPISSHDIYPLAQRLLACLPECLRRWSGFPSEPDARDRLANTLLMELTEVADAPIAEEDEEGFAQAVIIREALAGFVTLWGCRYANFDDDVDRAQAAITCEAFLHFQEAPLFGFHVLFDVLCRDEHDALLDSIGICGDCRLPKRL